MTPRFLLRLFIFSWVAAAAAQGWAAETVSVPKATRVAGGPIIRESMLSGEDGASINGPSLLRVPPWVKNPLGKYYLYFAHHAGKYLRLAYADKLEGPWTIYAGGVQTLKEQTAVVGHIASPDAIVDEASQRIYLFYHGMNPHRNKKAKGGEADDGEAGQVSGVAVSSDGVHFTPLNLVVAPAYLRVFAHDGQWFGLAPGGILWRTSRLGEPFKSLGKIIGSDIVNALDPALRGEPGALPVENRPARGPFRYGIRHVAADVDGDRLTIFFTCTSHRPERILATTVTMKGAPETWRAHGFTEVLRSETEDEGVNLPLAYSNGGISNTRVHELRDPGILREGSAVWLVYSIAGEHGLSLARVTY